MAPHPTTADRPPLATVATVVTHHEMKHVAALADSIGALSRVVGQPVEWFVVLDGVSQSVVRLLTATCPVSVMTNHGPRSEAAARNIALRYAAGTHLLIAAQDATLNVAACAWVLRQLVDADVDYVAALEGGNPGERPTAPGPWWGLSGPTWTSADAFARTATLRDLGGWSADPCQDDAGDWRLWQRATRTSAGLVRHGNALTVPAVGPLAA